jgi:hypothetical protein
MSKVTQKESTSHEYGRVKMHEKAEKGEKKENIKNTNYPISRFY